jgi:hypothetical protein
MDRAVPGKMCSGFPFGTATKDRGDFSCPVEEGGEAAAQKLCKCGRAPHRKGQRNCAYCNRDANRKYRISLKRMEARLNKQRPKPLR